MVALILYPSIYLVAHGVGEDSWNGGSFEGVHRRRKIF